MIDALFHLLNFAVLVVAIFYLGKRFIVGMLQRSRSYDMVTQQALQRQREELQNQQNHLAFSKERQQTEYEDLINKIAQWNSAMQARKQKMQQEQQHITHAIAVRCEQQLHEQELVALHQHVIPQAVRDAEVALRTLFAHHEARQQYMQQALDLLREVAP